MSDEHGHDHEHHHDHGHDHDHEHDHDHDHALIVERLPEGSWKIDRDGSEVLFKAKAFGFLPVTALFEDFNGEMTVDAAGGISGRLVLQTASINSGWGRRDQQLRGADYFQSDKYPEMVFTLEKIEPSGAEHQNLTGSLQIHQTSVPLSFPVYAIAHGDHLHLEGEVMVDLDLAGLGWSKPFFVGDRLRLETALTLTRA
jgi:polyisoprenoid-binding protein YceI